MPSRQTKRAASTPSPGSRQPDKAARLDDEAKLHTAGAASSAAPTPFPAGPTSDDGSDTSEADDVTEALAAWLAELEEEGDDDEMSSAFQTVFRRADLLAKVGETHDTQAAEVYIASDMPHCVAAGSGEIGIEGCLARCHGILGGSVLDGDSLVFTVTVRRPMQPLFVTLVR